MRRDANGSRTSAEGVALVIDSHNDPETLGIPWHVKHTWYMTLLFRLLAYCWVSPVTLLGGLLSMLAVLSGGRARLCRGVWETWGGWPGRLLESGLPFLGPVAAITFGHVVLGISEQAIHVTRVHERAHVRQYELWGLLFLLAYPLAGVWAWAKGGHPYRDNPFESEARKADKESG